MTSAVAITQTLFVATLPLVYHALNSETYLNCPRWGHLDYKPGRYLQLALDLEGDGNIHTLSYSIANAPDAAATFAAVDQQNSDFLQNHRRLKALHQQKMPVTLSLHG